MRVEHTKILEDTDDMPYVRVELTLTRRELKFLNRVLLEYDTLPRWFRDRKIGSTISPDDAATMEKVLRQLYYELPE